MAPVRRLSIHACSPWSGDCAMNGIRLNIGLGPWFIIVALTPEGRVYRGRWPNGKWVWFSKEKRNDREGRSDP